MTQTSLAIDRGQILTKPGIKIQDIVKILNGGGIVIFPTETLYGLLCDATNPVSLLKIYRLKNRPLGKSFPILVKDFKMLAEYAHFNTEQKKKITSTKKPTNFVLRSKNLSPLVTQKNTAAFRISRHLWIKKLFKHFDKPIVATSANLSGQDPLADPRIYQEVFGKNAEMIEAAVFAGVNRKKKGSVIVNIIKKPYKTLRV